MLKQKIISVCIGISIFAVTLVSCMGCIRVVHNPQKTIKTTTGTIIKKDNTLFPIQSFVMTSQMFRVDSTVCDVNEQNCITHNLATSSSVASGVIIKTDTEESYILTAGHVCMPPPPTTSIPGEVTVTYKIFLTTGYGKQSRGYVIALDLENDLCLVKSTTYLGPGLVVQEEETKLHSKVYNMASPRGLAAPIAVPVFDGYYTGKVSNRILFTIPAAPGSSGSPIMNEKNEIITIISAAAIHFGEFAICPTTENVKLFLLKSLPAKKEKGILGSIKQKLKNGFTVKEKESSE